MKSEYRSFFTLHDKMYIIIGHNFLRMRTFSKKYVLMLKIRIKVYFHQLAAV